MKNSTITGESETGTEFCTAQDEPKLACNITRTRFWRSAYMCTYMPLFYLCGCMGHGQEVQHTVHVQKTSYVHARQSNDNDQLQQSSYYILYVHTWVHTLGGGSKGRKEEFTRLLVYPSFCLIVHGRKVFAIFVQRPFSSLLATIRA